MNGVQKYTGTYGNGGAAQNLNLPVATPTQTITSNLLVNILVYWGSAMTSCTILTLLSIPARSVREKPTLLIWTRLTMD